MAGGHGKISEEQAVKDMEIFAHAGITTFDCADIYTGVEELIGKFLKKNKDKIRADELPNIQIHTKYVPDYNALNSLSERDTNKIIDRSIQRLGVEQLDLVQFAWWDYTKGDFLEAIGHLAKLQESGKIKHIGITNFNSVQTKKILDTGIKIVSNQVQYSVLDRRVELDRTDLIDVHKIPLLCYGTVAGGFLSDAYLDKPEPKNPLENRSLTKYRLIIEEFGTWEFFQHLLRMLRNIADQYNCTITEIALRYILQKRNVASLIVGARNTEHLNKLCQLSSFQLKEKEMEEIHSLQLQGKGPKGPFYELERNKDGKHGSIMRYNLNQE